ncbi:hypothetical protein [Methyloversatilis sp.]
MDEDIASLVLLVLALVCPLLLAWWLLDVDARPRRQHTAAPSDERPPAQ